MSLRLPDGLRERIKDAAERHGRSMNTEIVRVLEEKYPEPWPLDARIADLIRLLQALRHTRGHEQAIDVLTDEVLATAEGIASGRVLGIDDTTKARIRELLDDWHQGRMEDENLRQEVAAERYNTPGDDDPFEDSR